MKKYLALALVLASTSFIAAEAFGRRGGGFGNKAANPGQMAFKIFDEIDTNDDNLVTKAEADAFHSARFTEVDTNSDGSISLDEVMDHLRAKKEKAKAEFQSRFN